jgi:outer membrane murein-binding lipoprotein Lpp
MPQAVNSKFLSKVAAVAVLTTGFLFGGCSEMLSRDEFATRVQDKSDAEVAKLVGKPAAVDASAPDQIIWTYNSRTFNIEKGNKFDTKAVVVFTKANSDGKLRATDVKFE